VSKRLLYWVVTALAAIAAGDRAAWAQDATRVDLLVVVYNECGVEPALLLRAETDAGRVLSQAGVEVRWQNAGWSTAPPDNTPATEGFTPLGVHVIAQPRTLGNEVFGIAFVGADGSGQQADVFYAAVNAHRAQDRAVLLGAVMAHELGHLLLGSHSHTPTGIMKANWDDEALRLVAAGMASFNTEQAAQMRATIARKNQALSSANLVTGLR
jgi:hypothetical protein